MQKIIKEEEQYRFTEFSYEDAIRLSQEIFTIAQKEGAGICYQVIINDFTVVRGFLTGTDESNIAWLEKKKHTVLKSRKSSLRCGMEAELYARHETWQTDTNRYVIRGGGCPIWRKDGSFVGAVCISGLHHLEDHKMAVKALRHCWDKWEGHGCERSGKNEGGCFNRDSDNGDSGGTRTADF